MYKKNKKNKIVTFLCACLVTCATAFGLINSFGTTLASFPTLQTLSEFEYTYNNINSSLDFNDYYDGYFYIGSNNINNTGSAVNFQINIVPNSITPVPVSSYTEFPSSSIGTDVDFYFYSNFYSKSSVPRVNANTFYKFSTWDTTYLTFNYAGYNSHSNNTLGVMEFSIGIANATARNNAFNALQYCLRGYASFSFKVNGVYYNYCSDVMYNQHNAYISAYDNAYNDGYNAGEQSTEGYQNGYNAGKDDVLNNPNNYDLYTNQQYEQNYVNGYDNGYIVGVESSRYGSFGSYDGSLTITSNTSLDGVPTYQQTYNKEQSFLYKGSAVIINPTLLTTLSDYSENYRINIDITFNNPFTYSDKTAFNFVNNYLLSRYLTLDYTLYDVDNNAYVCSYIVTPVYDSENNLVDYTVVNDVPTSVYGKEINKLIILTTNNVNDLAKIALSQNSFEYENGYDVGYETGYNNGTNSNIVNDAYNDGYTLGNRIGYQTGLSEGLNNPDRYTFLGLLTGVVQAPVNVMKDLFDFNFMGFNMLNFFLGCITAVLIIWLIRLFLGGK